MNKRLILRNCNPDGTSANGFKWNTAIGAVNTCSDWVDNNECGNGLHGWLDGIGDSDASSYNDSPLWIVAEVEKFNDCGGKVKFESCTVVFTGTMSECSKYLYDQGIRGPIIGLTGDYFEGGDLSALTAVGQRMQSSGHYSTQTAGDKSTQTAGYYSTQTAGKYSNITCGNDCKVTAGLHSVVIHRFWYCLELKTEVFLIREDKADKQFLYSDGQQIEQ